MPLDDPQNPLDDYHHLNLSLGLTEHSEHLNINCGLENINLQRAMNCLLANIIYAHRNGKKIIGIPHRPAAYTRSRYNQHKVGYVSMIKRAIPFAIKCDWIELLNAGFGDRRGPWFDTPNVRPPLDKSRCTRYQITNQYWDNLNKHEVSWTWVQDNKKELLILKGAEGKSDYKDSEETERMREFLELYNSFLDRQEITHPDIDTKSLITNFHFKRVFNHTFEQGGRFYGHWVVTLKKIEREQLRFNGSPVCELDYKAMHPHLLYSLKGLDYHKIYKDNDPYLIEGFTRGEGKAAFNVALNNKTRRGFSAALKGRLIKEGLEIPEKGFSGTPYRDAIEEKHHPIKAYFYSGNTFNWGLRCQYFDSCIMEKLLQELMARDICCIPMHDGIIVPRNKRIITEALMKDVWITLRKTSYPGVKLEY